MFKLLLRLNGYNKLLNVKRPLIRFLTITPCVIATSESDLNTFENKIVAPAEYIKQACLQVVNSTSTLLTSTLAAIFNTSDKYKEALANLTSRYEECIILNGWNDELWDAVISLRAEMTFYKEELNKLLLYYNSVDKVVQSTIEATFNIDANYLCKTLCERNHSAEAEIAQMKEEIEILEVRYLIVHTEVAKRVGKDKDC